MERLTVSYTCIFLPKVLSHLTTPDHELPKGLGAVGTHLVQSFKIHPIYLRMTRKKRIVYMYVIT